MMKSLILPDGSWGGNYEDWFYENYPEWNLTDVLYFNQFDYYPKWDETNQEWYESATPYQITEFNINIQKDQELQPYDRYISRWMYFRDPIPANMKRSIDYAFARWKHDLLVLDPNYVFPVKDTVVVDFTNRFIASSNANTITVPQAVGHDSIAYVEINGTKINNPKFYSETGVIDVSVEAGDYVTVTY